MLPDLGVRVTVYPSWHESPYRWVMSAFEERDCKLRLWVDAPLRVVGKAFSTAADADAASPFRHPAQNRVDSRGRGRRESVGMRPVPLRWTGGSTEPKAAA